MILDACSASTMLILTRYMPPCASLLFIIIQGHGFRFLNTACGLQRYFELLQHQPFVGLGKATDRWDRGGSMREDLTGLVSTHSAVIIHTVHSIVMVHPPPYTHQHTHPYTHHHTHLSSYTHHLSAQIIPYSTKKYRREFILSEKTCYKGTICKPAVQNCRQPKVGT
jgi:hypothetical protein